jgi:hypothetical protein
MKKIISIVTVLLFLPLAAATAATIDTITIHTIGGYKQTYDPSSSVINNQTFVISGIADTYYLNDGTTWDPGAGWHPSARANHVSTVVNGSTVEYTLDPLEFYIFFQNTDYNSGEHSTGGMLKIDSNPVITAVNNTRMATMQGYAEIVQNEPKNNTEDFSYYSANVGDKVYYSINYWIYDAYWTPETFNGSFEYNLQGYIDFTNVVPEPSTILIFLGGIIGLCRTTRPW